MTRSGSTVTGPKSIGRVRGFAGPFGVFVRSYAFMRAYGTDLQAMSETAVLNANYVLARLADDYEVAYDRLCMHEFVLSARTLKKQYGVTALDIAKRLMDYGVHPPTIYFPLVVPEALMIEPTETESKERLDAFVEVMKTIAREAAESPRAPQGRAALPSGAAARRGEGGQGSDRQARVRRAAAAGARGLMPISRELIALSNELVAAVHEHDRARLEQLLAAEFTLNGAAGELDREAFLEAASGLYEIDEWAYEEIDLELYGNTAVVVSRYRQKGRLGPRDLSHLMHVTDIWVRRDGHWQIVRRHATIASD